MTSRNEIPSAAMPAGDDLDARIDARLRSLFAAPEPKQLEALLPAHATQRPWHENRGAAPLLAVAGVLLAIGAAFGLQRALPRLTSQPTDTTASVTGATAHTEQVAELDDPRAKLTLYALSSMEAVARTGRDDSSCQALIGVTPLPGTSPDGLPTMSCNVHPDGTPPVLPDPGQVPGPRLGGNFPWPTSVGPEANFEVLRELHWEQWPEARIAAVQEEQRFSLLIAVPRSADPGTPLPQVEATRITCVPTGTYVYYEVCAEDGASSKGPLLERLLSAGAQAPVEGMLEGTEDESVSNSDQR